MGIAFPCGYERSESDVQDINVGLRYAAPNLLTDNIIFSAFKRTFAISMGIAFPCGYERSESDVQDINVGLRYAAPNLLTTH